MEPRINQYYKPYKYRFYPTAEQAENLQQTFGCARLIYNKILDARKTAWDNNQSLNTNGTEKLLAEWKRQEEYEFLNQVSAVPLQKAVQQVGDAYQRFFKGQADYPQFKKKHKARQSITYTKNAFKHTRDKNGSSEIKLAKHTQSLKIRFDRLIPLDAEPSKVIVSQDRAGRYFISVVLKLDIQELDDYKNEVIGIDLGLNSYITTSQGEKVKGVKAFKQLETKLAKLQYRAAKKTIKFPESQES